MFKNNFQKPLIYFYNILNLLINQLVNRIEDNPSPVLIDINYNVNKFTKINTFPMNRDRQNSVIEDNYPRLRRNTDLGLGNILRKTVGNAFLKFFQETMIAKPTVKQNEEAIAQYFNKINNIIDTIDQHIMRRLENHENEVFSIVKNEIQEMKQNNQQLVQTLNKRIYQKNTHQQIWTLNNQLDYFKNQSFKLFEETRKLRIEVKLLKKTIRDYQVELETNTVTMQKLKIKFMREKSMKTQITNNLRSKISIVDIKDTEKDNLINDILDVKKVRHKRIKIDISKHSKIEQNIIEQDEKKSEQSLINIHISNHGNIQKQKQKVQQILINSIPSLSYNSLINQSVMARPQLQHVESVLFEPLAITREKIKYLEIGVQTSSQGGQAHLNIKRKMRATEMWGEDCSRSNKRCIDLKKQGFVVNLTQREKMQSINEMSSSSKQSSEITKMRYMSNIFIKNKLKQQDTKMRLSINHTKNAK